MDTAEIHLNPPHLGPVEVRISMNQDQQASIQFVSAHAGVREAIEAAVPQLREMLGNQHVALADVNVSNQAPQQQFAGREDGRQQNQQQPYPNTRGLAGEVEDAEAVRVVRAGSGVLSLYA